MLLEGIKAMDYEMIRSLCENAISQEKLVSIRREFHMDPEVSHHEHRTMERIASYLEKWDIPCLTGVAETGIVARLQGNRPGKNIALRADIDALPVQEKNTSLPYCSRNAGAMHACGHDAHLTILLGAAKALRSLNGDFPGSFTFIFQPDEEDTGGAQRMIAEGCLENPHVDHVIGLHVSPDYPAGTVGIKYGKAYACSDMFVLKVHGKSSHGASPHEGTDAIVTAAQIITAAQTIVSRNTAPTNSAVITFGTIRGGSVRNQIADYVECHGIIRALDPVTREFTCGALQKLASSVAQAMGASAVIELTRSYDPLINDTFVTNTVKDVAERQLGADHVILESVPQLGVEDFAYYAMERPSCFYHLGCALQDRFQAPLHSNAFDLDEKCLSVGVCLQVEAALVLSSH